MFDGDRGRTGGMGAYSPAVMTPEMNNRVMDEIIHPPCARTRTYGRVLV